MTLQDRPAVGGGATGVAGYEGSGLAHAAGGGGHAFLCVGAWHRAGTGGNQEAFRVILAAAAAKAVAARVTEAPPLEPAHQALGNHLIKTLPVLLGNEDPGKHCRIRVKHRLSRKAVTESRCGAASSSASPCVRTIYMRTQQPWNNLSQNPSN